MTTANRAFAPLTVHSILGEILSYDLRSGSKGSWSEMRDATNPTKLDPTITTDQIFPLFIAREMPIGLAGLIVAGIFAAAQSTVSTSLNSTATTLVTDFLRPMRACRDDDAYLRAASLILPGIGNSEGLTIHSLGAKR